MFSPNPVDSSGILICNLLSPTGYSSSITFVSNSMLSTMCFSSVNGRQNSISILLQNCFTQCLHPCLHLLVDPSLQVQFGTISRWKSLCGSCILSLLFQIVLLILERHHSCGPAGEHHWLCSMQSRIWRFLGMFWISVRSWLYIWERSPSCVVGLIPFTDQLLREILLIIT